MIPRWGTSRKKVSFQFNFEIVQRETRVAQVHWKCIPGSRRCEIESSRTYCLGFRPGANRDLSSVTDDLRWVCTVAGVQRSDRYRGGSPWRHLNTSVHSLNLMRSGISSQCNCRRMMSETDARCGSCRTSLAAARRTHCNFSCRYFGPAARSPLQ